MVIKDKHSEAKSHPSAESAGDGPEERPTGRADKFASNPASDEARSGQPRAGENRRSTDAPVKKPGYGVESAPDDVEGAQDRVAAEKTPHDVGDRGDSSVEGPNVSAHRPPVTVDDDPKRTTHHEILDRLLEKNEVIVHLNKKNVQLEARQKALEDKRIRLVAEFENYRKRTRKEWELLKDQTKTEVFLDILDVVDDFERAFSAVGMRDDDFVQGIRLIYNNMLTTLGKSGVTKMKALHEPFDPNHHTAVGQIESEEAESSHVIEVVQNGYLLNNTVIRTAKVVIAK